LKSLCPLLVVLSVFIGYGQDLYFPPNAGITWETLSPETLNWCPEKIDLLNDFLEANNTKAFILLKDGKIVIESYFDDHTMASPWYWASAGKSLTAFVVGIAQQEGFLSLDEPSSTHLGLGWTSCSPTGELAITIKNQLSMTTGLNDDVPNQNCTDSSCLSCLASPGTRWAYHNAPYTLLEQTVANATGFTLNNYTNQKVLNPTGMTGLYIPIDDMVIFFSIARSMARFGLLMLNNGNWDGNQIMTDTDYFNQMVTTSQPLNEAYGYLWWLNGSSSFMVPGFQFVFNGPLFPNAPDDTYVAMGKNGQYLNVVPSENMVWIRMGDNPDKLPVPFLLNDIIWEYISDLECDLAVTETFKPSFQITPNPTTRQITIHATDDVKRIELLSAQSRFIASHLVRGTDITLDIESLASGVYFVKVYFDNGKTAVQKIIKE